MFDLEQSIAEWRRQMLAAGIKSPAPLDELESHLREEFERQIKAGMSEAEAFKNSIREIGQGRMLRREFKKVTKGDAMINHHRIYSTVLALFAVFSSVMTIVLLKWQWSVGGPMGHLSERWLPWVTALYFAYTVAMAITLFTQRYWPESGHRLTRLLNWMLLPALPGGTILGLYGLWKVDREEAQHV